jgi:hypothetical protein
MSKIAAVIQKPEETPTDFYERLYEAFRIYTPFDPEAAENQRMVNTAFVTQSYADIRRKLQKLEGLAGMNATQMLEVVNKVFVNRENEEKQEVDKGMKAKVSLLAAALGRPDPTQQSAPPRKGRSNGRTPLRRDQCAYCKETGHWKNECPRRKRTTLEPNRIAPGKKTGWQPEPEAQDLIGLAGIGSD